MYNLLKIKKRGEKMFKYKSLKEGWAAYSEVYKMYGKASSNAATEIKKLKDHEKERIGRDWVVNIQAIEKLWGPLPDPKMELEVIGAFDKEKAIQKVSELGLPEGILQSMLKAIGDYSKEG
jgi:hypothetical protein